MVLSRQLGLRSRLTRVLLAVVLVALCAGGATAQAAGGRRVRVGRVAPVPHGARPVGALPRATTILATVALQPRDPSALAAYAQAVSTPGSGLYHQYLTVRQFAQRFGPTAQQVAAVRSSLRAEGLRLGAVTPNGLSFPVKAQAATLSSAFATSFERYRLRSGHVGFTNTAAPAVSSNVAGVVQGVVGLNTLVVRHPHALVRPSGRSISHTQTSPQVATGGPQPCSGAKNAGGYTADQIASAYGFSGLYGAGDLGSGVTVALYELEPYDSSDLSTYQSCYGTGAQVTNVNVDGGPSPCDPTDPTESYCGVEATLDIEGVIGLTPHAKVLVYQGNQNSGNSAFDTYSKIVSQDQAKVISTSWGLCESQEQQGGTPDAQSENTLFQEAATQGQSIFAAAGDSGADDCQDGSGQAVDDPASQPDVTGVGGTSMSSIGPPPHETVWNDGTGNGATGGGKSTLWPRPSYQSGFASSSVREVPDVSADADENHGYAIYYNGSGGSDATAPMGWQSIGGTSAAAPTWASLIALADASSTCNGTPVGFANPLLYSAPSSDFNDVTSGNNNYDGVTGYSAAAGYDMVSGRGTPKGTTLASSLCGGGTGTTTTTTTTSTTSTPTTTTTTTTSTTSSPPTTTTTTSRPPTPVPPTPVAPVVTLSAPAPQGGQVGSRTRLQLHATDSGGLALRYAAGALPPGLSINSATGLISGTPTRAGRYTARVAATDSRGGSSTIAFPWTIAGAPSVTKGSLRVLANGSPRLTLKLGSGAYAAAIKTVQIRFPSSIHLSRSQHSLTRGIAVIDGSRKRLKAKLRLIHGVLWVQLSRSVSAAQLQLGPPEISLTRALRASIASRHTRSATLRMVVTDASGVSTRLSVRIGLS